MALHDPDLQYQAELDKLTRERAFGIQAAVKAGHPVNTSEMIEALGDYLGDDQALAELMQHTLNGRNAFRDLLDKLALDLGEKQAREQLADAPQRRREQAGESAIDLMLWHRDFA